MLLLSGLFLLLSLLLYRSVRVANPGNFHQITSALAEEAAARERLRKRLPLLWVLPALLVHYRSLAASRRAAGMPSAPYRLAVSLALLFAGVVLLFWTLFG